MKKSYLKLIGSGALAIYCFYYLSTIEQWHFIDAVDLVLHEAGHIIFYPLGAFLMIAGGSLLQIIIPALFAFYFYEKQQYFSLSVLMYWLAINLFNVAHYAADAVTMQLPLLTGDTSGHDWHNMLASLSLLNQTATIATIINMLGVACIFIGIGFSIIKWREGA